MVVVSGVTNEQNINEKVGLLMGSDVENINCEVVTDRSILYVFKRKTYFFIKRLFDIICSLIGVIVLIPIALIVKLCYICTGDFHSIIYKQERIGKNGVPFNLYKFRTMVPNADEKLKELLKQEKYRKEWEKNQKFDKDPRITKVGNFLRKSSLDELPQVFSILMNNMSVIGPRPLVKGELEAHDGNSNLYWSIKPGITGWWASHGRSATSYEKRLDLEYHYIKHMSLSLDVICIIDTMKAIISKKGAK